MVNILWIQSFFLQPVYDDFYILNKINNRKVGKVFCEETTVCDKPVLYHAKSEED